MKLALPLEGVRVLDLTHVWSGPMASRVLGGLGADVIKIEGVNRRDPLRMTGTSDLDLRYPDRDYGVDPINRNAWFNTQNVDKRGLALDIKSPAGLQAVHRLAAECDVVLSNYRAGVLEKVGLGYAELRRLRRDIVVVEMVGFPTGSPDASSPTFGSQFDAASGSAWLTGDGTSPLLTGFALGDPVGGLFAAAAAVQALARRAATKLGCHIEVPQAMTLIPLMGDVYLRQSRGESSLGPLNDAPGMAPHGIFKTESGRWMALAIDSDAAWSVLSRRMSRDGIEVSKDWDRQGCRMSEKQRLHDSVIAWASTIDDVDAVVSELQARGVAAAEVATAGQVSRNPQLLASRYFRWLDHPSAGRHQYPSLPVQVDGTRMGSRRPAPQWGQHSREVLADVLGYSDSDVETLIDEGIVYQWEGTR